MSSYPLGAEGNDIFVTYLVGREMSHVSLDVIYSLKHKSDLGFSGIDNISRRNSEQIINLLVFLVSLEILLL